MESVKCLSLERFKKIANQIVETRSVLGDKMKVCGYLAGGFTDLLNYKASKLAVSRKIERNITDLRKSSPIRGTKAALHRVIYTLECINAKLEKMGDAAVRNETELVNSYMEEIKHLFDRVFDETLDFISKSSGRLFREIEAIQ